MRERWRLNHAHDLRFELPVIRSCEPLLVGIDVLLSRVELVAVRGDHRQRAAARQRRQEGLHLRAESAAKCASTAGRKGGAELIDGEVAARANVVISDPITIKITSLSRATPFE
jgi:hypothetical protein